MDTVDEVDETRLTDALSFRSLELLLKNPDILLQFPISNKFFVLIPRFVSAFITNRKSYINASLKSSSSSPGTFGRVILDTDNLISFSSFKFGSSKISFASPKSSSCKLGCS
ncbi:hypothetical protein OGATHE_002676 [Ogataea polymorpha]|uniref:Uncharacterized protein n=1 Tax=Ogataea polymorpha TaxID=460523 RepID=A0A9P8PEA1_9ASCO|nr:hypothetical protein OGATHE_002676 [Ogataea polymorpha]